MSQAFLDRKPRAGGSLAEPRQKLDEECNSPKDAEKDQEASARIEQRVRNHQPDNFGCSGSDEQPCGLRSSGVVHKLPEMRRRVCGDRARVAERERVTPMISVGAPPDST
jgi:hypothetical protein